MVTESDVGAPAVPNLDILEDIAAFVESATGQPADIGSLERAAAQNPDIPVGEVLSSTPLPGGSMINWTKQDTKVRAGNKMLPERFPAYGRDNNISMLPTAQMFYHLTKPAPDGQPAFRAATRGPWPGVPVPQFDPDLKCEFCAKQFLHAGQVEPHMRVAHDQRWATMLRIQQEKREELALETNQRLVEAQMAQLDLMRKLMLQGKTETALEVAQGAGIDTSEVVTVPQLKCPDCDAVIPSGKMQGLRMHQRKWCPERGRLA